MEPQTVEEHEAQLRAEIKELQAQGYTLHDQLDYWGGKDDWNVDHIYRSTLDLLLEVYEVEA